MLFWVRHVYDWCTLCLTFFIVHCNVHENARVLHPDISPMNILLNPTSAVGNRGISIDITLFVLTIPHLIWRNRRWSRVFIYLYTSEPIYNGTGDTPIYVSECSRELWSAYISGWSRVLLQPEIKCKPLSAFTNIDLFLALICLSYIFLGFFSFIHVFDRHLL